MDELSRHHWKARDMAFWATWCIIAPLPFGLGASFRFFPHFQQKNRDLLLMNYHGEKIRHMINLTFSLYVLARDQR